MVVGGTSSQSAAEAEEQTAIDYNGVVVGENLYLLDRQEGFRQSAGNPSDGVELTLMDRTVYARGPLPLPEAREPVWYVVDQQPAVGAIPLMRADVALRLWTEQVDLNELRNEGPVALDDQACDLFSGGRGPALAALNGTGVSTRPGPERPVEEQMAGMEVDQAEFKLWVCADGYVHQVEVHFAARQQADPAHTVKTTMLLHLWEYDGLLGVAAPIDPVPFPTTDAAGILPFALTATVANGGNVRAAPNTQGEVFDQIHAAETVRLVQKNQAGTWYLIANPRRVTGWVSGTLLDVDPGVAARLRVAQQ